MVKYAFILFFIYSLSAQGQFQIPSDHPDSLKMYESVPVPIYSSNYMNQYKRFRRIIVKVYPYALYAADVLYQLESDSETIN